MTMSELTKIAPLPDNWLSTERLDDRWPGIWRGADRSGRDDATELMMAVWPRQKPRLEQIVEEGLSRMDKAVNRVCCRYDGMQDTHPGIVVLKEVLREEVAFRTFSFSGPHFVWMQKNQYHDLLRLWYQSPLLRFSHSLLETPPRFMGMCIKFHYDDYIRVS